MSEELPEADAKANAELARVELRAQIDQQLRTADSLDTRTTALMTAVAAILALVVGRIQVGTDGWRIAAAILLLIVSLAFLYCALRAIASRRDFAYGAAAEELIESLEQYSHVTVALSLAGALRQARNKNADAINAKHAWYQRTVGLTFALAGAIAFLFAVGAIK